MTDCPEISILIVSYNTREMTLEAIRSAREQTRARHEIIVVDNASSDGSAQAIADAFPDIRLMAETGNHGFARANNLAAKQASGAYLLLLNPDTVVLDGAIDKLLAFARARPEAKIWGGRTLYGDGSLNPTNCWAHMSVWSLAANAMGLSTVFPRSRLFNTEGYGDWQRDTEAEVDIVTGCFLMIERAFWERLGGFDETFVMYGEEADLSYRARAMGARPRITPDATIIHYVGASSTVRAEKQIMVLSAKATLIRRHFRGWRRAAALRLLAARPWTRMAVSRVVAGLAGSEGRRSASATWREVWNRRRDWKHGYRDLQPAESA